MVTLDDVRRARAVIAPHIVRTPLLPSPALAERIGSEAWIKAESLQRTGSFKPRGAIYAVSDMSPAQRAGGIVTMSAGNAAAAIAYAGRAAGAKVTVVMPRTAPRAKVESTRAFGGEVLFAEDMTKLMPAVRELEAQGWRFLHPFDDDHMIAGHGSLALEVLEDLPDAGTIVVGVGGGGLISGIAVAAKALRPAIRVVGVEPEGAAGKRLALDRVSTIADALAAPFAGERPLEIAQRLLDDVVVVPDDAIAEGVRFLFRHARLVAEPGGAAATGALLAGAVRPRAGEKVVAVVSGANVDAERFAQLISA